MIHKYDGIYLVMDSRKPINLDEKGNMLFSIYLATDCMLDDNLASDIIELADAMQSDNDGMSMEIAFSIPNILDDIIDNNRYCFNENLMISKDNKPVFDKLKSELQAMIDKINSIEFVDDETDK